MSFPAFDKKFVKRTVRSQLVGAFIALLIVLGMGAMATWHTSDIVHGFTATYVETEGDVIDEGIDRVREGSRRNKHWEEYRTIFVQFEVDGTTHESKVRSESIDVGERVDIWAEKDGDEYKISLSLPEPPDAMAYVWGAVWALLTIGTLILVVRYLRLTATLNKFDPTTRTPDISFLVQGFNDELTGKGRGAKNRKITLTGQRATQQSPQPVPAKLEIVGKGIPPVGQFTQQIAGYTIGEGTPNGVVVLYAQPENIFYTATLTDLTT